MDVDHPRRRGGVEVVDVDRAGSEVDAGSGVGSGVGAASEMGAATGVGAGLGVELEDVVGTGLERIYGGVGMRERGAASGTCLGHSSFLLSVIR